jgi:hypothetical protein
MWKKGAGTTSRLRKKPDRAGKHARGAKAHDDYIAFAPGINLRPTQKPEFFRSLPGGCAASIGGRYQFRLRIGYWMQRFSEEQITTGKTSPEAWSIPLSHAKSPAAPDK